MSRPGLERSIRAYLRLTLWRRACDPKLHTEMEGNLQVRDGMDFLRSAELVRREMQFSIGMCSSQKYRVDTSE